MMLKMKKASLVTAVLLCLVLVMAACGKTPSKTSDESSISAVSSKVASAPAEKIKLKFYGKIVEYTSGEPMAKALQDTFKDKYELETIQVDWANLEQVIRTGIASGAPADVYEFWPTQLKKFVDAKMCLDLTPYLDADGGAWKKSFIPAALDAGKYDSKNYGVPLNSNFAIMYANADLLAKAGVTVPNVWTWEEFNQASKLIKEKSAVFPLVISQDLISWIPRFGMASVSLKAGNKPDDFNTGKVDFTASIFVDALKSIKAYNSAQYMYPGKGSITQKRDEAKAAFIQGKAAILGEVSSFASGIAKESKFKLVTLPWPSMGNKSNAESGNTAGYDGLFIPANAAHPEASVELLKAFLGKDIIKIHADNGYAPCTVGLEISDPIIKSLVDLSSGMVTNSGDLNTINAKVADYVVKLMMPDLCLANKSEVDILKKIESLK